MVPAACSALFLVCLPICFTALKNIKAILILWAIQSLPMGWAALWDIVFPTWFPEHLVLEASTVLLAICSWMASSSELEIFIDSHTELQDQGRKLPSHQAPLRTLLIPGATGRRPWKNIRAKSTMSWFQYLLHCQPFYEMGPQHTHSPTGGLFMMSNWIGHE